MNEKEAAPGREDTTNETIQRCQRVNGSVTERPDVSATTLCLCQHRRNKGEVFSLLREPGQLFDTSRPGLTSGVSHKERHNERSQRPRVYTWTSGKQQAWSWRTYGDLRRVGRFSAKTANADATFWKGGCYSKTVEVARPLLVQLKLLYDLYDLAWRGSNQC